MLFRSEKIEMLTVSFSMDLLVPIEAREIRVVEVLALLLLRQDDTRGSRRCIHRG